jgi:outer membrane murein-binding lipoprotein Lpp
VWAAGAAAEHARRDLEEKTDGGKGMKTKFVAGAAALSLVALAGCATKGDVEGVRSEIAGLRGSLESIDAKATRAEADASKAAADAASAEANARTAGDKADRIFREGLRK